MRGRGGGLRPARPPWAAHRHRRSDLVRPSTRRTPRRATACPLARAGLRPARCASPSGTGPVPAAASQPRPPGLRGVTSPLRALDSALMLHTRSLLPNTDLARAAAAAVDLLAGTSSPRVGPVVTASPRLLSSLVRYGRAAGPAGLGTRTGPPPGGPVRSAPGKNLIWSIRCFALMEVLTYCSFINRSSW